LDHSPEWESHAGLMNFMAVTREMRNVHRS